MWELRPIAGQQERASPFLGESLASLHAKTFVFDRKSAFVGSVNLDPRSIKLNTEVGVLIENEELAQEMVDLFQRWTSEDYAFELSLDEQGDMRWQAEGETWDTEPDASRFRRFMSWTLAWLPIASQL
ncbi:phospholipase D-like domain-containing protein [Halopseudomonas pachastrellae]|nr:phospholipase D-like domain-containing protein [Halopseudomonas pachastrellae]